MGTYYMGSERYTHPYTHQYHTETPYYQFYSHILENTYKSIRTKSDQQKITYSTQQEIKESTYFTNTTDNKNKMIKSKKKKQTKTKKNYTYNFDYTNKKTLTQNFIRSSHHTSTNTVKT